MLMIMVYSNSNIMLIPLCVLVSCIDAWLLLASVRWLLSRYHSYRSTRIRLALQQVTDPVQELAGSIISRLGKRHLPPWVSWVLVIAAALIVRHIILAVVVQAT